MLSSLFLLLAVTMSVQDATPAPSAKPRARRRAPSPVTAIAPFAIAPTPLATMSMTQAAAALEMASADMQSLSMQAPVITSIAPMAMVAPQLAAAAYQLSAAPMALYFDDEEVAEPDWTQADKVQGDAADSVYRAARQALNDNNYERAAELFKSLRDKYPRSSHVPNTYYWQAFALYRAGSEDQLRDARAALQTQARRYPKATTRRDAEALLRRVEGSLAQLGDEDATASAIAAGDVVAPVAAVQPGQPAPATAPPAVIAGTPRSGKSRSSDDRCNDDDDDDIRIAALNAVLQMDADRAVPLLKTVLARRDAGSACLRRKAVFLVSQKHSDETSRILLDAVRNDPDKEVREQAVFWLSQVPGEETVAALDSILQDPKSDPEIQEKAIFALSQHRSPRAAAILCTYSGRSDRPADLRDKSIFWLGQRRTPENLQCLRDLYKKLDNDDLKEKVIFSLSQMGGADNYRWLMDIALNTRENIELRKKALFWAGQGRTVDVADLIRLYDSMSDREGAAFDQMFVTVREHLRRSR